MHFRKHFVQEKTCSGMSRFQIIITTPYPWLQWDKTTFCPRCLCKVALDQEYCSHRQTFPVPHTLLKYFTAGSLSLVKAYKWIPNLWGQDSTPSSSQPQPLLLQPWKPRPPQQPCLEQGIPPWAPTVLQGNETTTLGLGFAVLHACDIFQCLDNCSFTSVQRFEMLPTQKFWSHICWH